MAVIKFVTRSLRRGRWAILVASVADAFAAADGLPPLPAAARPAAKLKLFDGMPKTIVTISNSHRGGGRAFEAKVRRHFADRGEKCPITFRGVSSWQTPVDPVTGEPEKGSWLEKLSFEKDKASGNPVVVIALCGVTMPKSAKKGEPLPVNDETVAAGVARCEHFVRALKQRGADEVFLSSYHYLDAAPSPAQRFQYEPEYTLKVYDLLNKRAGGQYAIDCLSMTKQYHPAGVGDDQFHPSAAGHAMYAHCWFEALLRHDGLDVPAWSAAEAKAAVEAERAKSLGEAVKSPTPTSPPAR